MTGLTALAVALSVGLTAPAQKPDAQPAKKAQKANTQIGHMVYFKLKDATPENQQKLVAACKKDLGHFDGVVFFAAGVRGDAAEPKVNDIDWDVALHVVFANKAAHTTYLTHPDHLKFIDENKALWGKVRVFDSEFTPMPRKKPAK